MGLSQVAADGYDLSTVAEDIHQLAVPMGHQRVKVVGHDWGAAVGAAYALRYRQEVTKLVFIEGALAGCGFETLLEFWYTEPGIQLHSIPAPGSWKSRGGSYRPTSARQ